MDPKRIRIALAIISGILLATFGVFLFSDFMYRGLTLRNNIYALIGSGNFRYVADGFYQLFGSGFLTNIFLAFSRENLAESSVIQIIFGEELWPAFLTWFSTGFVVGCFVKGLKQSLIINAIVFGIMFLLWLITGIFAGADMGMIFFTQITNTLGILFTAIIFHVLGGVIGGLIGGPNYYN